MTGTELVKNVALAIDDGFAHYGYTRLRTGDFLVNGVDCFSGWVGISRTISHTREHIVVRPFCGVAHQPTETLLARWRGRTKPSPWDVTIRSSLADIMGSAALCWVISYASMDSAVAKLMADVNTFGAPWIASHCESSRFESTLMRHCQNPLAHGNYVVVAYLIATGRRLEAMQLAQIIRAASDPLVNQEMQTCEDIDRLFKVSEEIDG